MKRLTLPLGLALAAGSSLSAQIVALYLQPDEGNPIANVELSDPSLVEGSAVLEGDLAERGWWWGEYTSTLTGFVHEDDMGDDGQPAPGAIARSAPSKDADALSVIARNTPLTVLSRGKWSQVRYEGAVSVYFQKRAAPVGISPTIDNAMTADSAGSRAIGRSNMEGMRTAEGAGTPPPVIPATTPVTTTTTPAPAPAPVSQVVYTPPPPTPVFTEPQPAPQIIQAAPVEPPPMELAQHAEGILRKSGSRFVFFNPKFPFYLEGLDGKRRAWLDLSARVNPEPLAELLDRPVLIYGEQESLDQRSNVVIRVRTMRLK